MPISRAIKPYHTFVRGIITEASALSFPENASLDEQNFVLNRDGSRQRRLGLDYELNYVLQGLYNSNTFGESAITFHRWDNVGNDATKSYSAVQVGTDLLVFDASNQAISSTLLGTITLNLPSTFDKVQSAVINGELVLNNGGYDTTLNVYRPLRILSDLSTENITLEVRDIFGVDDGLEIQERPPFASYIVPIAGQLIDSDTHFYNLYNQGWGEETYTAAGKTTFIQAWDNALIPGPASEEKSPSNADIPGLGVGSDNNWTLKGCTAPNVGNTPAPRGLYTIDAMNRGASRIAQVQRTVTYWSGVTTLPLVLPDDKETGVFQTVANYAGRLFFSGVMSNITDPDTKSPNYTGYVFFSQLALNAANYGKCYQEADPTSDQISDLIDTDGGHIVIPEASNIQRLVPVNDELLVMAETGVWSIRGGDGGFKATDYQVRKLSDVGIVSGGSVVDAESGVFYWSQGGIYAIVPDDVTGHLTSKNISETTVQSLYTDINSVARAHVEGSYDPASKKVTWLYNDLDSYDGITFRNRYNKELVLDTVLSAYSVNSFDESDVYIAGYATTPDHISSDAVLPITAGGVDVTAGAVLVTLTVPVRSRGANVTKYVTAVPVSTDYKLTFSALRNDDFKDFQTFDSVGKDFTSYLLTGHEILQDSAHDKQAQYIWTHFKRTETGFTDAGSGNLTAINPSSCLIQARWDFADHVNSGKFGTQFQAYRLNRDYVPAGVGDLFNYGQSVISTKNKLRGRGKALSLYISSESGKDLYILGWSTAFTGNPDV